MEFTRRPPAWQILFGQDGKQEINLEWPNFYIQLELKKGGGHIPYPGSATVICLYRCTCLDLLFYIGLKTPTAPRFSILRTGLAIPHCMVPFRFSLLIELYQIPQIIKVNRVRT